MKHFNPAFLRLRLAGKKRAEIAEALGVKVRAVEEWIATFNRFGLLAPVKRNGGRSTPTETIEEMRDLYVVQNLHIDEVCRRLNMTRPSVEALIKRHGFKRPAPIRTTRFWTEEKIKTMQDMKRMGKTDAEIGLALNLHEKSIYSARRRYGINSLRAAGQNPSRAFTEAQTETVRTLWLAGWSGSQIGAKIGKSRGAVHGKVARMGLPARALAYPTVKKKADRDYASVAAAARARAGMPAKPRPKAGPKEDSNVIPLTARPWLTRERGECNYPYGPRGDIHSCCQPVWNDTNMCESHYALCHDLERMKRRA